DRLLRPGLGRQGRARLAQEALQARPGQGRGGAGVDRGPDGRRRRGPGNGRARSPARHLSHRQDDHPLRLRGHPGRGDPSLLRGDPRRARTSLMPLPYYVSPEQMMKDKAEYARKGISRGKAIVALQYRDRVLPLAENPSALRHKSSEIYDRIAFAGVGKYNEFENLRVAGVRHADIKGYSYSRGDVTAKSLANAYSQALGNIFTQDIKPFEVEVL